MNTYTVALKVILILIQITGEKVHVQTSERPIISA